MPENEQFAVKCCVCGKVRLGAADDPAARWVEQKDAGLTGSEEFSDTYCPPCAESAMRELKGQTEDETLEESLGGAAEDDEEAEGYDD
jgi:hypothetical protein